MKWGKVDFKELKQFQKNLEKMRADTDKINTEIVKELAARVLREVKQKTPAVTGELRRNWKVGQAVKKDNYYEVEIYNHVEYAPYVEYGHRQVAKGKKKVSGWTQGRFMLKISCDDIQSKAPAIVEKRLKKELEALFNAK
ncbi:MAG: HK97 gp10 family phage protein [Candidatus Metalachnospira sp.]|nr:HK97 gp10 family phage protein [Candidatus Metalachnospira sp.]